MDWQKGILGSWQIGAEAESKRTIGSVNSAFSPRRAFLRQTVDLILPAPWRCRGCNVVVRLYSHTFWSSEDGFFCWFLRQFLFSSSKFENPKQQCCHLLSWKEGASLLSGKFLLISGSGSSRRSCFVLQRYLSALFLYILCTLSPYSSSSRGDSCDRVTSYAIIKLITPPSKVMFSRRSALQLLHRLNSAKLYSTTSALLCKCRSIGLQSSVPLETTPGNKAFKPVQSSGQFNVITRQLSSSGGSGEQPPQKSSKNDDDDKSNNEEEFEVPLLMDGILPRGMPNLFFTLKNFYLINFVLRPQIDKSFDIKEFIEGAKQVCSLITFSLLLKLTNFYFFFSRPLSSFPLA